MQEYSSMDNIRNDLTRMSFTNSNNPFQKKQDQNIFLQKTKTSPNDLITPFNNKINNSNDLNTYNNEINRMDTISHEIIEKDKEIQELKNSLQQHKMEMDAVKLQQNISTQIEQENKALKMKLQQEYKKNDEAMELKHGIEQMKRQYHTLEDSMFTLENIIRKQYIEIQELKKKRKPKKKKRNKYTNDKLMKILLDHDENYTKEMIVKLFNEMEITNTIKITKDLLMNIINYLNDELSQ